MNDITTTTLWMAVYVALISRRWALAGLCCGLALLVRPNLLPLAGIAGLFVCVSAVAARSSGAVVRFGVAALPFALLVLWLNAGLYASPFRTGYGEVDDLFALSSLTTNVWRYAQWLIETHTVFPLFALAAPLLVAPEQRRSAGVAVGLILATWVIYLFYTPFDDWSYLRFLLPAISLMIVLACAAAVRGVERLFSSEAAVAATAAILATGLVVFGVRAARDRQAFNLQFLEQRYRSAGSVVRDRLPDQAVVLSVWDSGAVRFHGRRDAIVWDSLDPAWLDRSLEWLAQQGRPPYLLLESWEEPRFRERFGGHSLIGRLDWPPKYEIDRMVRIYDPRDRPRFDRGEQVSTEYLWPFRK